MPPINLFTLAGTRLSARDILGKAYIEDANILKEDLEPPEPDITLRRFWDRPGLKNTLRYADTVLRSKRRTSPVAHTLLGILINSIKDILEIVHDREVFDPKTVTTMCTFVLECQFDIAESPSPFLQAELATRYGDYMDAVCERLGERWDQNKEACTNEPALKRRWDDLSLQLRQENPDWYDCSQPDETNPPTQPSPWVTTSPTTPITSVIDACARMALPLPRTLRLLTPRDPFSRASWLRLLRTGKGRASDGMLYNGYVDAAMSAPTPRMGRIMQAITMGAIQDNFDIKSYNKGAEDRQYCSFAIRPRTRAAVERMNACEHGSAEREFVDEQRRRVVDGVVERMEKEADPNRFGQYRDEEIYDAFLERERRWNTVLRWAKGEAYGVLSCREEYWSTSGEGMRNLEECGVGTLPS